MGMEKRQKPASGVMAQAMGIDHNKAIKIARQEHRCHGCGSVIKCGDRFTMRLDYESGSLKFCPTCLSCDGRFERKKAGNDGEVEETR